MKNWIEALAFILICCFTAVNHLSAQDDIMDLLILAEEPQTDIAISTFKGTRIVTGHSVETNAEGVLQFLIGHRFGRVNSGFSDFFGLDNSTVRLGFEYGLTDNINIGIGRSSYLKIFDGSVKWRFLRQSSGDKNIPVSIVLFSSMYANSSKWRFPDRENRFTHRLSYHHSLLIARKFGDAFSLQIMPTAVHRNLVSTRNDKNTLYAIGAGASVKITGSVRLNAEYYYLFPGQISENIGGEKVRNALSLGIDLETGGHIFQLHLTNARAMTEKYLIDSTTGSWMKGDIHFGFNISRVFTIRKPKEFRSM